MKQNLPTIGVLIRFASSEATLPRVLAAFKSQTRQPDFFLGVACNSHDNSRTIMRSAGFDILEWTEPYHHSRVLNFGLQHLRTDLVLVLSSHTVLESPDAIETLAACFDDERVACASAKWDDDPYYSDAVTWAELQRNGLRFGSIYSNSMGMIRRLLWEKTPFDEEVPTAEDYLWALEQMKTGYDCRRVAFSFSYQRSGTLRDGDFARVVFSLAKRHGLRVAWLGWRGSLRAIVRLAPQAFCFPARRAELHGVYLRLRAWLTQSLFLIRWVRS
ncbi:hypothetical protein BH11VER1_BH11VER1_19950 [soil metagenome]